MTKTNVETRHSDRKIQSVEKLSEIPVNSALVTHWQQTVKDITLSDNVAHKERTHLERFVLL